MRPSYLKFSSHSNFGTLGELYQAMIATMTSQTLSARLVMYWRILGLSQARINSVDTLMLSAETSALAQDPRS